MLSFNLGNSVLFLIKGDITEQDTDAIVNAADPALRGGLGVDGAIHSSGGPRILEECIEIRNSLWPDGLQTGRAVITTGGNLMARYVIHTVGPIWKNGTTGEPGLLRDAYINSLNLAITHGIESISFPSISTGSYGYPIDKASRVVLAALKEYLTAGKSVKEVRLVLFKNSDLNVYEMNALEILSSRLQ